MGRAWTPLFLLQIAAIFLFVGIFYLTFFASTQKSWAQTVSDLLSHCQNVGNVPNPYDVANQYKNNRSGYPGSCSDFCNFSYSSCQVRNLCQPTSICNDLITICQSACNTQPPPPSAPTCFSLGGNCMHRLSCAPDYVALPNGDNDCSKFGNFSCCVPKTPCEFAGGTCVSVSSQNVAPCPAGMSYNTSISCNNNYAICCAPPGAQPGQQQPPPPRYNINGYVWVDTNRDRVKQASEPYYTGHLTVQLSGAGSATTDTYTGTPGPYGFFGYHAGNYTVSITVPGNYDATTITSQSFYLNGDVYNIKFGIVPYYSISGNVFNDLNKDREKDLIDPNTNPVMEPNITSPITIASDGTTAGGNISYGPDAGSYTISHLYEGQYFVYYTSDLPLGFFPIYPINGPPRQFHIYVGPNCYLNVNLSFGSTCYGLDNGNVQNANFAISNSIPWFQTYGLNMRQDEGFEDSIPASPDYPRYASVADNANGASNLITMTPTPTVTPTLTPTPTPVSYGNCTTGDGYAGKCYDRQKDYCVGYYDDGWYCPGGDNIQCCVKTQVSCKSGTGTCHNRYSAPSWMSPGPNNGNTYACTKTWTSNLCPGPNDVQCCAP